MQEVKTDLRKFNHSEQVVGQVLETLGGIQKVETQDEADLTLEFLKTAKKAEKTIEEKRKELVKPFNDAVKRVNSFAKDLKDKLPSEVMRVKGLVISYQTEQERKAAEQKRIEIEKQRKLEEEAEAERLAAEKADGFLGEEEVQEMKASAQEKMEASKEIQETPIEFGSVKGIRKIWTYEVKDETKIPREYLMVDTAKINAAVKSGERSISGVNIFQKSSLAIR